MRKKVKVAAMADIHIQKEYRLVNFGQVFSEISNLADILLIGGDLTAHGHKEEASILAEELNSCKIPIVGVLGNHDFENDQQEEIIKLLSGKIFFLGEQSYIYEGVGFSGVKGFCGGFNEHLVAPFGEKILKQFVYEAVKESVKLQEALTRLETEKKVVLLHYSPIRQTIDGEPPEIYPLLGTSRLVEPIENFNVTAVFHGHAHHGSITGKTAKGIPVYNVSIPLLLRNQPNKPYIIVEI